MIIPRKLVKFSLAFMLSLSLVTSVVGFPNITHAQMTNGSGGGSDAPVGYRYVNTQYYKASLVHSVHELGLGLLGFLPFGQAFGVAGILMTAKDVFKPSKDAYLQVTQYYNYNKDELLDVVRAYKDSGHRHLEKIIKEYSSSRPI